MNRTYTSYFPVDRLPARTTIGVTGLARGALVEIARILDNAIYIDNIYSPNSFRRSRAEKDTPKYGMTCDIGASGCCAVRLLSERAETQQT
jgi:hypothetical protein